MKKIIILLGFALLVGTTAMAQWTTTGTTVHPTTLTNKVGVGTTDATTASFYILRENLVGQTAAQERIDPSAAGAALLMRKARGTSVATKSAPLNNDVVGGLFGQAWDGAAYRNLATMRFLADGNVSAGNSGGKVIFQTTPTGTTALADRMIIRENGFVGIGTTNPQSLLSVNGKVSAKEVEVTLSGWSDFVFASDYSLRPLSEVESFINTNKHLPDVPSEAEVLANGVNVGDMSATLLQKIEELTLYIIDLNKRIAELEK